MSRKKTAEPEPEEAEDDAPEEPTETSPAAGACVLVVLGGAGFAGVWAASQTAAVLTLWGIGARAIWWAARRRMSDMCAAPPPPLPERPSCSECAGHDLLSVTPLEGRKGMLIYKTATADRPNHTHIHIQETP